MINAWAHIAAVADADNRKNINRPILKFTSKTTYRGLMKAGRN